MKGTGDAASAVDSRVARELAEQLAIELPAAWADGAVQSEKDERVQDWRLIKDKSRTSHVLLLLCLNVGIDPPDVLRVEPCAKLECWTDPLVAQSKMLTKGSMVIGDLLIEQYKKIYKGANYKAFLELSVDDLKYQLGAARKKAREGRVLLHYNGHGVPRVTQFGELWFFDSEHRQYVPMTISDIMQYVGSPTTYILDCNNAGAVLHYWYQHGYDQSRPRDVIICACRRQEDLPQNPALPADLLTSCLTTPIKMGLEWYYVYSTRQSLLPHVTKEMIDAIPGTPNERKTPLGELYWIFTAVTDAIAWCSLKRDLFNRLFRPRSDMLQMALFRNYLLAERIMRDAGCVPVTHPALPPTHNHPMWEMWELALESVLSQLPNMLDADLKPKPDYAYKQSTFFADQLTAFEVCVDFGCKTSATPDQLPCIIQGLSASQYRLRSLRLLARFLDLGPWAVNDALACGVMPYVTRLLHQHDLVNYMVVIWTKLLLVECSEATVADLVKLQQPPAKKLLKVINVRVDAVTAEERRFQAAGGADLQQQQQAMGAVPPSPTNAAASAQAAQAAQPAQPEPEMSATQYPFLEGTTLDQCQAMGFFVLSMLMNVGGKEGQVPCWNWGLLTGCLSCLMPQAELVKMLADIRANAGTTGASPPSPPQSGASPEPAGSGDCDAETSATTKAWALICLAQLVASIPRAIDYCVQTLKLHERVLARLIHDPSQDVRACACFCLAKLVGLGSSSPGGGGGGNASGAPQSGDTSPDARFASDVSILQLLATAANDPSPAVRTEVFYGLTALFAAYRASPLSAALQNDMTQASRSSSFLLQPATMSTLNSNTPTTNYASMQSGTEPLPLLPAAAGPPAAGAAGAALPPGGGESKHWLVLDACRVLRPLQTDPDPKVAKSVAADLKQLHAHLNPKAPGNGAGGGAAAAAAKLPQSTLFARLSGRWRRPLFQTDTNVASDDRRRHRDVLNRDALQGHMARSAERAFLRTPSGPPEKITRDKVTITPLVPARNGEVVVASEFRALAPHAVLADSANRVSLCDVGSHKVLSAAAHPARIAQTFLVNDATDNPLLLLTDKVGNVSVYSNLVPQKAQRASEPPSMKLESAFSAATKPSAVQAHWDNMAGTLVYSSGDCARGIHTYSLAEERLVQTIPVVCIGPRTGALTVVKTAPSAQMIAAGFEDGTVRLWDARSGSYRASAQLRAPSGQADAVLEVALKAGAGGGALQNLYSMHRSGAVRVWDMRSGRSDVVRTIDAHKLHRLGVAKLHHTLPVLLCGNVDDGQTDKFVFVSTQNSPLGELALPKMPRPFVSLHKYQAAALIDRYVVHF